MGPAKQSAEARGRDALLDGRLQVNIELTRCKFQESIPLLVVLG